MEKDLNEPNKNKEQLEKEKAVRHKKPTVPDKDGHYDIDGVSYADDAGVVVASDGNKPPPEPPQAKQKQ
jgi:hypothetical protein